ncbi:unnamed protein product [Moneuplotes crassus]|uniref:Uncharacterized protein n=1 Tax=Euplotes crassus TaxID=5936 RepID=A0AAD1XEE9_EUPCR|nr:unnamed protein product [Moneuplotes crassus]
MQLRDAPRLYPGKGTGDDDVYIQRIRQNNMKEIIKQQVLDNQRAKDARRYQKEQENEQIKYNFSIRNKLQNMTESSEKDHSRQIRKDIDSMNSIETIKRYGSKRIKKYSESELSKSLSENRAGKDSHFYSQLESKNKRSKNGKFNGVAGKVGELNYSSPRDRSQDIELLSYHGKNYSSNLPPSQAKFLKKSLKKYRTRDRIREIIKEENNINDKMRKKAYKNASINKTNGSIILKKEPYKELAPLNPGSLKFKTPQVPKKKEGRFKSFPKEGNSFVVNNRVYKKFNIIGKERNSSPAPDMELETYKNKEYNDRRDINYRSREHLPHLRQISNQIEAPSQSFGHKRSIMREPEIGNLNSRNPSLNRKKTVSQNRGIDFRIAPVSSSNHNFGEPQNNIVLNNNYGRSNRNNLINKLVQQKQKNPTVIY